MVIIKKIISLGKCYQNKSKQQISMDDAINVTKENNK